ncbi:YCH1 (YGR203W) [Zygosaccharomyces parabailii]|nr:YCH1 (YGR203W) [Zygosaccharomyces parabailii]CDH13035.1 related to CDC25-like phosphatase YCH1 [Zygosaccharomyces bailii ISA1307]
MQSRTIKYLDTSQLYTWMKRGAPEPFQVIDVRGSDYKGGHIKGGWNYPCRNFPDSITELTARLNEKRRLSGCKVINVVFHCARSQQRGPRSAMMFLKDVPQAELTDFNVYVLRGGFNHWKSVYGRDSTVTED